MDEARKATLNFFIMVYFSPLIKNIRVYKANGRPIAERTLDRVQTKRLLRYRIEMDGLEVTLERLASGEIGFEWNGATRLGTHRATAPARNILQEIGYLGTFYDKNTGKFYF